MDDRNVVQKNVLFEVLNESLPRLVKNVTLNLKKLLLGFIKNLRKPLGSVAVDEQGVVGIILNALHSISIGANRANSLLNESWVVCNP
jgi:hypothetical protein